MIYEVGLSDGLFKENGGLGCPLCEVITTGNAILTGRRNLW
jgi:hypothetical protein